MRVFIITMCVLLALIMPANTSLAEAGWEHQQALDLAMESEIQRNDGGALAGLAVEAIVGGEIVYKFAGGRRIIDNYDSANDMPFETNTRVRIASVSKSFVAVGIMQLVLCNT